MMRAFGVVPQKPVEQFVVEGLEIGEQKLFMVIEEIVQGLPSTRIVTIDGPHLALCTNPQAAAEVISGMMRKGGSA
ncbi:MAG: hypothetical protein L0Z53_01610 [Acidobacteriales bacterium]|nr:hypothetical protein [Terriglobales bacterium]